MVQASPFVTICVFPGRVCLIIARLSLLVLMSVLSILRMCLQLLTGLFEELGWLEGMLTGHIMESGGGDVIGLSFADEGVVFEQVLQLRGIEIGLRLEDFLRFVPAAQGVSKTARHTVGEWTAYSEMSSNSSSSPRL